METNEDRVKITIEIPKQLRGAIRLAAARNDRLMSEELREALISIYGGVNVGGEVVCAS